MSIFVLPGIFCIVCVTLVDFSVFTTFYPFYYPCPKTYSDYECFSLYLYGNTCICGMYEFCVCLQMKDMTCEELVKEVAKM